MNIPTTPVKEMLVLGSAEMAKTLKDLVDAVAADLAVDNRLAIIGIQRRGVELAERIKGALEERLGTTIPLGKLDINMYRDDWTTSVKQPNIGPTHIDFAIDDLNILLVDDVLFTGRTIRSALEAILDYGRPKAVKLLVLVDRGHRELPIQADYVGMRVDTAPAERVDVFVSERDSEDKVCLSCRADD
ncbi:bifunctional pyr operon transcriptional regulator/uracil phosphoribosyltransferase PyrR [Desulfovibrio inopinatus]|uniref:bifunctional pyr operon transcriptional regulator/uracil phosphoribosyltransferase PyrR n=1 Tax=Desulfovibrio inopinatus TaxID=102109 RepID=UPI00054F0CA0|nr:bifunctional pyr operon transcriptional regulator/uracil phosphoribosyltransferase PyrR [Desulfovibrio inopinatus]